jgi:hypothetical protein
MSIGTRISSYLIPRAIWESGYISAPPLALPARDALDIERRWRKGVILRNEAKRYAICCKRMQGIARELEILGAPIPPFHVWKSYDDTEGNAPRALAYLALFEYLRRFYKPNRQGAGPQSGEKGLKYDRVEAIFHPPDQRLVAYLSLLSQALSESKLSEMCLQAVRRSEVLAFGFKVDPDECEAALRYRHTLAATCVKLNCGLVDVLDLL